MDNQTKIKNNKKETLKAGCVVVNQNKEILLISDSKGLIWTFPKGHAENNETPEQTSIRETLEETGYYVKIIKRLSDVTYVNSNTQELIRVSMFLAEPLGETSVLEKDIQIKWVPLEEAKKIIYHNLAFLLDEFE
jgi:8-oxo-dGTP pyrophosphatase MutT (NUDIX family)